MTPRSVTKADLARASVLVVGDAMLDRYWHGQVDRISPEAPVPVVRVVREEERVGGAGNVAFNVARLGAQASFLGILGEDEPGHRIEALLRACGVQTRIQRDATLQTTVKLRVIGRQQQLLRLDFENEPGREALARQGETFAAIASFHQAVLFSDYGKGSLSQIRAMLGVARSAEKMVLVDPKGSDYARYRGASVLTPNRAELQEVVGRWSGEDDLRARAQTLRAMLELDALLVTRSEEGMTLFDAEGDLHVPAEVREVFDVTGAGDTVIATLAVLVAAGWTLREALPVANRAAGLVVGKFGTASVSYEELFG